MKKRLFVDHIVDFIIFFILVVGTMSAITYLRADDVFDADISFINNQKMPYSVILNIDNLVEDELEFDIEVIYLKENLVVASDSIDCQKNCEVKLVLNKIFFDDYQVVVTTKYQGAYYRKKLHFDLEKQKSLRQVLVDNTYEYNKLEPLIIDGKIFLDSPSKVILEIYPKDDDSKKEHLNLNCKEVCEFAFNLTSQIVLGEYSLNVYFVDDVIAKSFFVGIANGSIINQKLNESKSYINISKKKYNQTLKSSGNQSVKISLDNKKKDIVAIDLLGDVKIINNVTDELELPSGYVELKNESRTNDNLLKIKPEVKSVDSLEDVKEMSTKKISRSFGFTHIDYNSTINVSNGFDLQSVKNDFNPIESIDEKVYVTDKNKYLDILDESFNQTLLSDKRKIVPGVYKKEKIIKYRDGTQDIEENIFAYGLISVNTKKPLYEQNELVEIVLVVLDKKGYLVSDASIDLMITKPNNETLLLNTDNLDIVETSKKGVYTTFIDSDLLGHYKMNAVVELDDMIVDVSSYFNVVDNYEFEILRNVPATIDPWDGPFENVFEVEPLNFYRGEYDFTEVFSSDFEVIDTDADEIIILNESTYLVWKNLHGKNQLSYTAQVPLKSPYLYYLGKSWVSYNEGFLEFYENRSWLFAIDPAAKTCDFTSPCICGSGCAGGSENSGDGTIDSCGDGNTNYEFINDIRVTSLSGDYFGVGDTVEVCMDYQCDTSSNGDRVTWGYKNGGETWINSHAYYELRCDNNNLNTHCENVLLDNYVGTHHFRGKLVWEYSSRPSFDICDQPTYYDHDDVEIQVLDKVAPSYQSSFLDNGTVTGNNLIVIRGKEINATVLWDLPLQSSQINHDGAGFFNWYDVDDYSNNQSFYVLDTSDVLLYTSRGNVNIDTLRANDLYFDIQGLTPNNVLNFDIYAEVKVNQSSLTPSVGYPGINATMSCQITDFNVDLSYSGLDVSFYKNGILLGNNITNGTGWAKYTFQENTLGEYNISCDINTDLPNFIIETPYNSAVKPLFVRMLGADIVPPVISSVNITPDVFSIGGVTLIGADVTDDVSVGSVSAIVILPDLSVINVPLVNTIGNRYEVSFTNTLQDGDYEFYIYAEDSSGNPAYSSNVNFEVTGVRTFIGIQATKSLYKLGENLDLIPYTKVNVVDGSSYSEIGDSGSIEYTFDTSDEGWTHSGSQDEWERGTPTDSDLNRCDVGNCWTTDRNSNYNNNANNNIESPVIDMTGRTNAVVQFWKEIKMASGINDKIYFESFDGSAWNILYQNTIGAHDQEPLVMTYYPSEIEGVSNARFRFRMTSDGGTTSEGFVFDTVSLFFDPRVDWDKDWTEISSSFGSDVGKLTAIKIEINITSYDATGSNAAGSLSPDIEVQIYDGSTYSGSFRCNLDSSKSYPYNCVIAAKSDVYLDAWKTASNRRIRFRAISLDGGDSITWTDVKREYVTPSIIENNGVGVMSAYLLEQFKNSTGGIVSTLYFNPISLNPGESRQLSDFWSYAIAGNFQLGNYTAYVALTDASRNVLQNEDDGSYINDSYEFEIQSLIINPISPLWDSVTSESLNLELTLDTTSYGAGGWCGYSLNGALNVSMNQLTLTHYDYNLGNVVDGENEIIYYCNDTDGDVVDTGIINFNVSQAPRIQFVNPTPVSGTVLTNPWVDVNVSVYDASNSSSYIDFNSSLVAYWNFENVSGTTVYDDSSFSYDGVLSSGAKRNFVDKIRGSYGDFDGIDDAMVVQNSKDLEGFDAMTIEAWVKPDLVLSNYGYVLAKRDNTDYSFGIGYDTTSGDNWHFYVNDYFTDYIEAPMSRGVWSHVVAVYNSTNLSIYINGDFVAGRGFNEKMDSTPNVDVVVGARRNFQDTGIGWPFSGNLDEVKLWNRGLSPAEIKASYNSKINDLDSVIDSLKNSNYEYYACAIDAFGNRNCTEVRNVIINKNLGTLVVTSPVGVSKFSMADIVYFNATTSLVQDVLWIEFANKTRYNLTNVVINDWSYNSMFSTGYYDVVFYAEDSLGNILNSSSVLFVVLPDKSVEIVKSIEFRDVDSYGVKLNFSNQGRWMNYSYLDFRDIEFNEYAMSIVPDLIDNEFGFFYNGEIYLWNVSVVQGGSSLVVYSMNGTSNYFLKKNYIVGLE